jgi:hypothetical protein
MTNIKPAEISEILKQQLKNFKSEARTGRSWNRISGR